MRPLILASCAMIVLASASVFGAARVHFADGRVLEAASCSIEQGIATVTLAGGDTLAFPAARITRVENVPDPPPPAPAQPQPIEHAPVPVPPAAPPAAAADPAPGRSVPAESTLEEMIRSAAARHNLEADLLAAVIAVESGFKPRAVSPKGAQGLMQLMPGTAKELSVTDPFNPAQNIEGGARYLRQLIDQHDGSYWRALAAYNAGARRASQHGGLPPYRETISYIHRVLENYARPRPIPQLTVR